MGASCSVPPVVAIKNGSGQFLVARLYLVGALTDAEKKSGATSTMTAVARGPKRRLSPYETTQLQLTTDGLFKPNDCGAMLVADYGDGSRLEDIIQDPLHMQSSPIGQCLRAFELKSGTVELPPSVTDCHTKPEPTASVPLSQASKTESVMPLSDSERRACEQYEIDPRLLNASGISRLRTLQRCGTSAEELRSTSICDDFLQSPSKTADSDIPDALAICGEPPRGQGFTSWWNWTDRKDRLKCAIAARDSAAYLASFATEDSVAHSASGAKGDAAEYLASRRDQRAWNLLRECPSSASLTCQQLFGNQKVPDDDAAFAEWQRICGGLSIAQKLSPLEDTLREFVAAFPPQRHGYFGFNLKAMMALDPLGTKNWWYPTSANWLVGLLAVAAFTKNACISQSSIIWRGYPYYMFAPMFEVPKDVDLLIRTCQEKLLIVGLVLLGRSGGHQNALIFDYVDYTVSRSEPHGQQTSYGYSPRDLDEKLEAHFTSIDSRWRYLGTEQACLATGLQTLENKENVQVPNDPGGFCQAWTLYWAHMRLLHPSATRKQLIKESTDALLWAKAQGLIPNLTAFIAAYSTVLLRAGLVLLNAMRPNVKPLVMSDYGNMTKKESEVAARLALTLPTLMAYVARFQTSKSGGRTVCAEGRQPKLVPLRPSNCGKICRKIPPLLPSHGLFCQNKFLKYCFF